MRFYPIFTKISENTLQRKFEKLSQIQFNSTNQRNLSFSIRLRGLGSFDLANKLKDEQVEIVFLNGTSRKLRLTVGYDLFQRGYWTQNLVIGNVKEIIFSNPYYFDILYVNREGYDVFKDWVVSSDGKSVYRDGLSSTLKKSNKISTSVSYLGKCNNFNFKSNSNCTLSFKFSGSQNQLNGLREKLSKENYSVSLGSSSNETYINPKLKFKLGKVTRNRNGFELVASISIPSNTRRVSLFETGYAFDFKSLPTLFSSSSTSLIKIR